MIRGEVVRLFPTPEQEKMFRECIGYARFSYNYCKNYLPKLLRQLKHSGNYDWMKKTTC